MKCPPCGITFLWHPGDPDPDFGELFPAPRSQSRAFCPVCLRRLWKTDKRWLHFPIQHRNPIEGPSFDDQIKRGLHRQLTGWPWRPALIE